MKRIIILLLLCLSIYGYAQVNYSQEEGKVTNYEMTMESYENDKEAEALVIYELGDYRFITDDNRGFLLKMTKRTKVKILKQAGIKYATFEIPYYTGDRDWESIESIKATTYNAEVGKLIKANLENKNIFEEKVSDKIRVKKVTLPDVREGSVIEMEYTIVTPYYFNMRPWDFQKKIPVVYSKLQYRAIPYYEYTYIVKGANKFDEVNSVVNPTKIRFGQLEYQEMIYDFGMKNLPAFRDEEFITSDKDYMVSLNFQMSKLHNPRGGSREIITTWPAMCDDFLKDDSFGKYIKNVEKESKKILPTLNIEGKTPVEQIEAITEYVKTNYNWNGFYGKYANEKLSDFIKKQTGNVANLNLFLVGLYKAAGLEAYPVVLSTRKNGMISQSHPFQQFFNYVIAQVRVGDKVYHTDATEPLLYYNVLPERCLNVRGLVVKPKAEEWINVVQGNLALTQKDFVLNILPEENKAQVQIQYSSIGQNAYHFRSIYMGKAENIEKYLKERNNIEVKDGVEIGENNKLNRPFVFSFNSEVSVENSSDKLFIHPFCNLSISDNMFKQTSRALTIDIMYLRGEAYRSTINIPKGYKAEYLPKDYHQDDNMLSINYNVTSDEGKIVITANYTFKHNLYEAKNYISLKMSMAEAIKRFSEMIVLVKES